MADINTPTPSRDAEVLEYASHSFGREKFLEKVWLVLEAVFHGTLVLCFAAPLLHRSMDGFVIFGFLGSIPGTFLELFRRQSRTYAIGRSVTALCCYLLMFSFVFSNGSHAGMLPLVVSVSGFVGLGVLEVVSVCYLCVLLLRPAADPDEYEDDSIEEEEGEEDEER